MFRKAAHNNESGVALLFALGILSLLLVLGLAFASNALLAQKVAYNNSSRSQAKLLAQSAISRIAIAMMYYQYQADAKGIIPVNYSAIYSDGADGIDEDGNVFADGLYSTDDSLLTPPTSSVSASFVANSNTYKRPKWAFVFDKPKGKDDRKIIGRIAYQQVIDDEKGISKIDLDNVLHGIYSQETDQARIPWNNRWGKSINELNLGSSTPFKRWKEGDLAPESASGLDISSLADFFIAYSAPSEPFFDYTKVNSDGYKNKNFVERWFTGGKTKAEPEFYRYDISSTEYKSLHRFNLGDLYKCDLGDDKWYDRFRKDTFLTINKNTDTFLTQLLAADSKEFNLTEELTPPDTGIPFLKQIANEQGTFDTLATRRKQIAANLNDYCDSDSKPTSDVDATNWSVEGVTEPTFTGNERTPYIYELGYRFAIHQGDEAKTAGIAAETNGNIRFRLELYPAVKLAQIYKDVPSGFTGFSFKNSVREITLEGKITGATYHEIKYKYGTDGAEIEDNVSISLPASGEKLEKKFSGTWPSTSTTLHAPNDTDNSLSFSSTSSGYPFQAAEMTGANRWYCDLSAKNLLETDEDYLKTIIEKEKGHRPTDIVSGPTSITVNKVEITRIAVKRGPLLLLGTYSDGEGGSSTFGVDYVRSTEKKLEYTSPFIFSDSTDSSAEEKSFKFLLGGIRGIDPRQNLNENDWFVASRITQGDSKWEKVMCVSSNASGAITGEANKKLDSEADPSHPSPPPFDPGAATDTSKYDTERKASNNGPAWGDDTTHLSTAYIRNAPMQSLWELGVIHRGAAWQTLNLKAAGAPGGGGSISPSDMKQLGNVWDTTPGTTYAAGDGGILEQVKLTKETYCFGKVNINMLAKRPDEIISEESSRYYDSQMAEALFYKIRYGQEISNFETNPTSGTEITTLSSNLVSALTTNMNRPFASRTQFLDWKYSTGSLSNAFGLVDMTSASDAQQEEIVGKTINLLKAEPSASNIIQFIVVAQTIRDLSGSITRVRPDDAQVVTKDDCAYGQFDVARYIDKDGSKITSDASGKISNDGSDPSSPDSTQSPDDFIYFDEITGEVKMLVTLEKVSEVTGQIVVTSIEYID